MEWHCQVASRWQGHPGHSKLIPLGIRLPDRPSDSQTVEEDTSLISPHLLYKFIFLSSQSDRVLAESIPLNLLAAPTYSSSESSSNSILRPSLNSLFPLPAQFHSHFHCRSHSRPHFHTSKSHFRPIPSLRWKKILMTIRGMA
jgi:hypothetical protein